MARRSRSPFVPIMPAPAKTEPTKPWQGSTIDNPLMKGPTTKGATGQGPQKQETTRSGPAQGSQIKPSWGPATRPSTPQPSSIKREIVEGEDSSVRSAKRQKSEQQGLYGSPPATTVGFRPANRSQPSSEDLELTRSTQKAKSDSGGEDPDQDPSSPQATVSRRVSELRGARTRRSSRSSQRQSESRLRSGLSREWSMDS